MSFEDPVIHAAGKPEIISVDDEQPHPRQGSAAPESSAQHTPTDRLATLKVPTLAIHGSRSFPWIRATAQAVADVMPLAQHLILPGEDHTSVLQHPEALRKALVAFLT